MSDTLDIQTDLPEGVIDPDELSRFVAVSKRHHRRHPTYQPVNSSYPQWVKKLLEEERITSRDYHLLMTLYGAVPVLSRDQIQRLFWGNCQPRSGMVATQARLRKLTYDYRLLGVNKGGEEAMGQMGLPACYAYYLDTAGMTLLAMKQGRKREEMHPPRQYDNHKAPTYLVHDLMLAEVYTRLTEMRITEGFEMRWVSEWKASIRQDGGQEVARPDGMLFLKKAQSPAGISTAAYYLELERNPSKRKWVGKVQGYETAVLQGNWRSTWPLREFPRIWVICPRQLVKPMVQTLKANQKATRWVVAGWPNIWQGIDVATGDMITMI